MSHRIILVLQVLVGLAMVALSLVWPQGQGAVSPAPFNRPLAAPERTITVSGQPVATIRGAQTAPDAPPVTQTAPPTAPARR